MLRSAREKRLWEELQRSCVRNLAEGLLFGFAARLCEEEFCCPQDAGGEGGGGGPGDALWLSTWKTRAVEGRSSFTLSSLVVQNSALNLGKQNKKIIH